MDVFFDLLVYFLVVLPLQFKCLRAAEWEGVSIAVLDISLLLPASSSLSHVAVVTPSAYRHGAVDAYPCLHAS